MREEKTLLRVEDLKMYFPVQGGLFSREKKYVHAVDGVSFDVKSGETLGIVGESGCGKSTVGNIIMRLLKCTSGNVTFDGKDILSMSEKEFKPYRKEIQMVFQDPFSSLNPRKKVSEIIAEPYLVQTTLSKAEINKKVDEMMDLVGLDRSYESRYPHEFSGGQRQRIGIARALALNPKLVILDEPVSALDVSIQSQILNLLKDLQEELGLTYIFIAHGLPTVQYISDRIVVMYLGRVMEIADEEELFRHTMHPYTEGLLSAIPVGKPELRKNDTGAILEGDLPSSVNLPKGCRFCTRCKYATDKCREIEPPLTEVAPGHSVSCHFPL